MLKYSDFINEKYTKEDREDYDVKGKVERSKKLPKEMKEKILPLINNESRYKKGIVTYISKPIGSQSLKGCGLGADKNGFFVFTHRARSKSHNEINNITKKEIDFIESTG